MEEAWSFEMLVSYYITTWYHIYTSSVSVECVWNAHCTWQKLLH